MCMDTGPFQIVQDDRETSLEQVVSILLGEGGLTLIDLFGKKSRVEGAIREIDLLNRRIVLA